VRLMQAGHIEDVVVDKSVRGQHLGQRLVWWQRFFLPLQGCLGLTFIYIFGIRNLYKK
jgi:hypothetical protein